MENKKYFIGLDMGTNTVGWAVIDEDYNVLRFKGKHMWGTRLIDNVNTAADRRAKRSARRHYERRRQRIELLQELIGPMVLEVDQNFFMRLNTSFLKHESQDSELGRSNLHILFDGKMTDVDYYEKYPTIYHLRKAMIEEDRRFDIREIYLALHHLVKYRGNFLYEGDVAKISNIKDAIVEFFEALSANFVDQINPFTVHADEIVSILTDKTVPKYISKKKNTATTENGNAVQPILTKEEKIANLFDDKEYKGIAQEFVRAVVGYSFSLSKVLCIDGSDKPQKDKVSFKNDFEEGDRDTIYESVNQNDALKQLEVCCNIYLFGDILSGEQYVCNAMIKKYEKHAYDLKILKSLVKIMDEDANIRNENGVLKRKYRRKMFYENGGKNLANYAAYVENQQNIKHNGKERYEKVKLGEFYKFVEKFLENAPDCPEKTYILFEIENGTFMPKLNDVSNGAVPHQFNLKEMEVILQKQGKYYPMLKENAEKIISILTFRRPFYVGVLSEDSPFAWSKGLYPTDKKLYPWNFMQDIDKDGLAENFINQLTGKCYYFKGQQVMPKQSITYQAYACLNELNKIKIKGEKICPELKMWVFDNVMCKVATLKVKRFVEELKKYDAVRYATLTGGDIEGLAEEDKFANGMTTFSWFRGVLKEDFDVKKISLYDEIVRINTVFSDKDIRKKKIAELTDFNEKQLDTLYKKDFAGWGKYSKKFLNEIRDANNLTILEELYLGYFIDKKNCKICYNINELIYDEKLGFNTQLTAQTEGVIDKFEFDKHIKDLYCSPKDKSIIWQAICIVEEIVKIMGCPPHDIYIETTREDAEKKKTTSRYKNLKALYDSIKNDNAIYAVQVNPDAIAQMDKLKAMEEKSQNIALDDDKLYLYLLQLGRCMYSGDKLAIDNFAQYEIDHIIPRAYIKDDSFSNRVLVKRIENQRKSDLALNNETIYKQKGFWKLLLDHNFMTKKKFQSLTRGEFSDKDIDGFISRQLVETSQIVKTTMNLLLRKYGIHDEDDSSRIKGVKASLTSQFRKSQMDQYAGFAKIRGLNDMHHAKDAYLAAVLGHFTTYAYPCWGNSEKAWKIRQDIQKLAAEAKDGTHEFRNLINRRNNIILEALISGRYDMFDPETGELLQNRYNNILINMAHNDCIVTKKIDERANAQFYDQTVYSASESERMKLIPLRCAKDRKGETKPLPTNLYGGYTSIKSEYCAIIKHSVEDKSVKVKKGQNRPLVNAYSLKNVPVMTAYAQLNDENAIAKLFENEGLINASLVKKVHKNQVIKMNGQLVYIVSCSEMNNATQLVVDAIYEKLLYIAEHFANKKINKQLLEQISKLEQQGIADEFIPYFVEKVKKHYPLFVSVADKVNQYYTTGWNNLDIKQKLVFINEILKMTAASKELPNLKAFELPTQWGRLTNKTIDCKETEWVYQSVTGLYSKTVKFDLN